MPQTKFVTGKALGLGLNPIVIINKIDRGDARASEVLDEVFDLFTVLEASDEQLDFPFLFAVGRDGWASEDAEADGGTLQPLFEMILHHVPSPDVEVDAPFAMLATLLDADPYLGRVLTGRIAAGRISQNDVIKALNRDGEKIESARVTKLARDAGAYSVHECHDTAERNRVWSGRKAAFAAMGTRESGVMPGIVLASRQCN